MYEYVDKQKHMRVVHHGMMENPEIICDVCLDKMHRLPQAPRVNWGGLPPHAQNRSPEIENWISNADRSREQFEAGAASNPYNEFRKE